MKSNKTISQMYDSFIKFIRGIKFFRNAFTNEELVKNIPRSLPKEWLSKMTSLKNAKYLSKVQLDKFLSNLIY